MDCRDWSELPREILSKIMEGLCITNIVSVKDVCRNWHSAVREEVKLSLLKPIQSPPWLTISNSNSSRFKGNSNFTIPGSLLFNFTNNKVYYRKEWIWTPPVAHEARCIGSCHGGWLAYIDCFCVIYLTNLFIPHLVTTAHNDNDNGDDVLTIDVDDDDGNDYSYIQLPSVETLVCNNGDGIVVWEDEDDSSPCLNYKFWNPDTNDFSYDGSSSTYDSFVTKLVMSDFEDHSTIPSTTVMIIFSDRQEIAFCKSGDKSWRSLNGKEEGYLDLCYSDHCFYALGFSQDWFVQVWDLHNTSSPKIVTSIRIDPLPLLLQTSSFGTSDKPYLTRLHGGELLLIVKHTDRLDKKNDQGFIWLEAYEEYIKLVAKEPTFFPYKTFCFVVYKLDMVKKKWVVQNGLGNGGDVLFLGINNAVAVSATDFPELKRNSIYFTDDRYINSIHGRIGRSSYGGHDLGIFSFEDCSIHPLNFSKDAIKVIPPPVWIFPNHSVLLKFYSDSPTTECNLNEEKLLELFLGALICDDFASSAYTFLESNNDNEACQRLLKMWESLKPSTQKVLSLATEVKVLEQDKENLKVILHKAEEQVKGLEQDKENVRTNLHIAEEKVKVLAEENSAQAEEIKRLLRQVGASAKSVKCKSTPKTSNRNDRWRN